MNNKEFYIDLINRYFANEIQEEELNLLAAWLKQSDENKAVFEEHRKFWETINKSVVNTVDAGEAWEQVREKLFEQESEELPMPSTFFMRSTFKSFMRIAAGFVLLVVISFTANRLFNKFSTRKILAGNTVMEYTLPDSSIVTLNKGSLEFRRDFKNRKLAFNGEAFFEIKHHAEKPLTIAAENLTIQDVGTEFYVNTLSSTGNIVVILKEGSVLLYNKNIPEKKYPLIPGQKASFDKNSGEITISENADQNYLAWKTKELVFDNESLDDVVSTLNKVYKSNIIIKNEALKKCRVTSHFKGQSLHSVLEVLKATLNLTVANTQQSIEISGNGCK